MMKVLVTGAAGFIGRAVSQALLERGDSVVAVDNLNDAYDVGLKKDRIRNLADQSNYAFIEADLGCRDSLNSLNSQHGPFRHVVHLAAQAGVRKSMDQPHAFLRDNVEVHLNILELCRTTGGFEHLVFASSSSVYGANPQPSSSISDSIARPMSTHK